MIDVTGKEPMAPSCQNCSTKSNPVGLEPSLRYNGTRQIAGYWICPNCHHVFRDSRPVSND